MFAFVVLLSSLELSAPPAPAPPPNATPAKATPAAAPRRVVVSEFEVGYEADPKLTHTMNVLLTSELRRRPALSVISHDDVRTVLGLERQRQLLRCGSVSCLTEIAGALGAGLLVAGSFSKVGDSFVLVARVIDTSHARVLHESTRRMTDLNQDALAAALSGVANDLFPDAPAPSPAPDEALLDTTFGSTASAERPSVVPPLVLGIGGVVVASIGAGLGIDALSAGSSTSLTYATAQGKNGEATAGLVLLIAGLAAGAGGLTWGLVQ